MPDGAKAGQKPFWTLTADDLCATLQCGPEGLSAAEAARRLQQYGPNADAQVRRIGPLRAIARRLRPIPRGRKRQKVTAVCSAWRSEWRWQAGHLSRHAPPPTCPTVEPNWGRA